MTEEGSFIEVEPKIELTTSTPENHVENGTAITQETVIAQNVEVKPETNHTNGTTPTTPDSTMVNDDRGRGRRKRDFFGTIKRRLGRSKNRSKSMDRAMAIGAEAEPGIESRSISADRGQLNTSSPEGSAISGTSVRTYVNEASTLVLETLENGVRRHFLVPVAVAQRPRWRRKGTKLHIYNDHTFVAKHLSGGQLCTICQRSIPRRPGKQGYECRDCNLRCHKQCHVKAPQLCPNPTVLSIELSKLNSPLADRHIRKL
ncbi:putative protein kinase C delta type homolog isoform X2 [Ctenocephalides felis]|uniref:putative protein kinase C delta type homolog isoform X2 n=1 Tax=Ctenocephalides felis TaxID=7515 RepID=UPI000E6E3AD7|nr:putative protein kinase C delta type homolog isoform X2 [Ctenocephalides felis]